MMDLKVGIKGSAEETVDCGNTAAALGSGSLEVYATPAMVALMEKAALSSVQPYLEAGQSTVGTALNIRHSSASPLGMSVRAESEVTEVDRRRIVFNVRAYDDAGLIGEGSHERFIVDAQKFLARCREKKE